MNVAGILTVRFSFAGVSFLSLGTKANVRGNHRCCNEDGEKRGTQKSSLFQALGSRERAKTRAGENMRED